MPEIQLTSGALEYRVEGSGPPVVLIHGAMVNGRVWERLVPLLARRTRCIVPDLPLGAHRRPMSPGADMSPPGLAALIAEMLDRLELEDVTLVGNDTGGALSQLVAAHHPERLSRLVLINCDAFEHFPPPSIAPAIKALGRLPGSLAALELFGRLRAARNATKKIAPLTVEPVPDELLKSWIRPLRDRAIRADLRRVFRGIEPAHTLAAAEQLRDFERPALIVWGMRDRFFPVDDAERLAHLFPNARLERVDDARTFVQLDKPERVAELIEEFISAPTARQA